MNVNKRIFIFDIYFICLRKQNKLRFMHLLIKILAKSLLRVGYIFIFQSRVSTNEQIEPKYINFGYNPNNKLHNVQDVYLCLPLEGLLTSLV